MKRSWLAKLSFPFPIHVLGSRSLNVYHYAYRNSLGIVTYKWKIEESVDQNAVGCVFSELTNMQVKYSTRAMRRDFLVKCSGIPKYMLHNIVAVGRHFQSMHVKDYAIKLGVPANETDITELFLIAF